VWRFLEERLSSRFGDKVVVAFAHGVDPKVDPRETIQAAAQRLVNAGATLVLDAYQSSIFSDSMNTCMMRVHAEHALHDAGFHGRIVTVGQAGHDEAWAGATADSVGRLLEEVSSDVRVSVHLMHHGARPGSSNPCREGPDAYHANARKQYELVEPAVAEGLEARGNATIRFVYGSGASAADDGVLSPMEALALDRAEGIQRVLILPYEVWGNGVDTLVYLRESLGFQPEQAPYYDAGLETRFTHQGLAVHVASAGHGLEGKSDALLAQILRSLATVETSR
jgi:hypothetical protein